MIHRTLRTCIAAAGVFTVLAFATSAAQARDVNWSVGVSSPGVAVGVSNGYPIYAPQPVYVTPPRPVYYAPPAPVYYSPPAPVYYGAPVYAPAPSYYYRDDRGRGRGHGRGHHGHHGHRD